MLLIYTVIYTYVIYVHCNTYAYIYIYICYCSFAALLPEPHQRAVAPRVPSAAGVGLRPR